MKNDTLIMIKVINTSQKLIAEFETSYAKQSEGSYTVREAKDICLVEKLTGINSGQQDKMLAVFVFLKKEDKYVVDYMYLGMCNIVKAEELTIQYQIKKKFGSQLVIQNMLSFSELDLKKDFEKNSYVNVEYSQALIRQLQELLIPPQKLNIKTEKRYEKRSDENNLHEFAQHNEHCRRAWDSTKVQRERSEFQRDRERIFNSKAFRIMVDKAQIFTSSKGDHYRTRMTHTLEVAQISRSIANSLGLNIDLTEAIALGHDLGHTPFGHQGERTLDDIINGRTEVLQKLPFEGNNPYGGFKHNFQSLRMLTKLEEKYVEHPGLDVSYQVLEGVLKHTSHVTKNCEKCEKEKCEKGCCDSGEFAEDSIKEELYLEEEHSTTLEGQVVALADEIAQRSHDIDDAFSSGLLTFDEFQDYLKLSKLKPLAKMIEDTYNGVEHEAERILVDHQEMLTARIISDIISYLVNDVVKHSGEKMSRYDTTELYYEKHRFEEKLVEFSEEGKEVCSLLERLISKRAINCLEVTRFDRNAAKIVKYLFKAYYDNPKLIHEGTLRRMYIDMRQYTDNVIDFVKGDPKLVKEEFQKIISYPYPEKEEDFTEQDREYYQKRKILIRHIVDFIAGMTDSYAINEYERLR